MTSPCRGGGGGGGGIMNSDGTNLDFLSHNFLFHSLLKLLWAYMPMTAKWEVHRLSGYLIEGAVWGFPLHTKSFSVPLPPPHCLPRLWTDNCRNIDLYFRTVVANSNFQTHPVCYLLSTNVINPSENIFNNDVM